MNKATLITGILLCTCLTVHGQKRISWQTLSKINYSYIHNYDANIWYGEPEFGEEVKVLDQQTVIIKGYVLPLDADGNQYVLSANPFSSCFFCGGAGQESIMELRLRKKKSRYETDQIVTFIGVLKLNDQELELNYILEDARPYEE